MSDLDLDDLAATEPCRARMVALFRSIRSLLSGPTEQLGELDLDATLSRAVAGFDRIELNKLDAFFDRVIAMLENGAD